MEIVLISDPIFDAILLTKDEGSVCDNRVHLRGSRVFFRNVKRHDAGRYTINSFNAAGQGKGCFQLRIHSKCV